jgi:16S rRNA (uracil1498-N3)-methyltransferase
MQLFFHPDLSEHIQQATFPKVESQHIVRVLRKQIGDEIEVTNGRGDWFLCKISMAQTKACKIEVLSHKAYAKPHDYYLHILVAPTKSNERFEWFLEKATELGIHKITPLLCSYSERKKIKLDRYQKVVISAMKQSKRLYLPVLDDLTTMDNFIKLNPKGVFAHCYEGEKHSLNEILEKKNCPILIGPEGDFTNLEVEKLIQSGYQPITLGKTRLRTETAGIYSCALSKSIFE